jgi:hypothetical protein
LTAARDKDIGTLRNQALRRRQTDSAIASRDDGNFPSSLVMTFLLFDFYSNKTSEGESRQT